LGWKFEAVVLLYRKNGRRLVSLPIATSGPGDDAAKVDFSPIKRRLGSLI